MNHDTLRLTRNILLRSFLIGLVITIVLSVLAIVGWQNGVHMAGQWFQMEPAALAPLIIQFFLDIRFFLLFILLTPALAIHWTLRREQR